MISHIPLSALLRGMAHRLSADLVASVMMMVMMMMLVPAVPLAYPAVARPP
jgi:hypothetical protein